MTAGPLARFGQGRSCLSSVVLTSDGRRLAVEEWGEPGGSPVFFLHGTPGSRLGPIPRAMVLHQLRIRIITFDRPGYGRSDRRPDRTVADVVDDVREIADSLHVDRFGVIGRSGGGPHALACAALLPERTTRAAVLVGLAPSQGEGLDWFEGMTSSNTREYRAARGGGDAISARYSSRADGIRANPTQILTAMRDELTQSDRWIVGDAGIRRQLIENYAEAVRYSADGWIDDVVAFSNPWGFDPADIRIPTMLWHGANDRFSPVGHLRWLAARIPSAIAIVQPGMAHFGAIGVLPDVLRWSAQR